MISIGPEVYMIGHYFIKKNGNRTINRIITLYKFIEDVAYPMRLWFYIHFRGKNIDFSKKK